MKGKSSFFLQLGIQLLIHLCIPRDPLLSDSGFHLGIIFLYRMEHGETVFPEEYMYLANWYNLARHPGAPCCNLLIPSFLACLRHKAILCVLFNIPD